MSSPTPTSSRASHSAWEGFLHTMQGSIASFGGKLVQYKDYIKKEMSLLIQVVIAAVWSFFEMPFASSILGFAVGGCTMELLYKAASQWDIQLLKKGIKKLKLFGKKYSQITAVTLLFSTLVSYKSVNVAFATASFAGALVALKFKSKRREAMIRLEER